MQNYGLLVDYNKLNTTGKIARCPTKSKPYKKNGWYVVYTQDNFINAAFGDYQRNESPIKWHNKQQLNITEKNQIQANAALTQKHIQTEKHQKALYYANKYAQFEHCINHNYTTNKKLLD
ncbi:MAG: hypothetical protein QG673_1610 [Pseudomonadota bacterium]|nr:hypothetical protein [Pseudomonadota bacterium]